MTWKYLKEDAPGVYHLDHRLAPEVSAMFAAMSSRLPSGGIAARYEQIVQAVLEGGYSQPERFKYDRDWVPTFGGAEDVLCEYPIHPKVQEFFDLFVLEYGHSSIMELTGQPAVYTEGISWYDAYLLFDSPLCAGQEFSTRAVRHKDWPMAMTAKPDAAENFRLNTEVGASWILEELHNEWFEIFEAEVEWWKVHLSDADNRAALGIADNEPFRPALDRARWAIPGTISTGCCHTGHLRERARILHDGLLIAQKSGCESAIQLWENFRKGYAAALPGLSGMGLREAVYGPESVIPAHLVVLEVAPGPEVQVQAHLSRTYNRPLVRGRAQGARTYLDPDFNHLGRVDVTFQCSLAVSRDWHRHRTMYPWSLDVVRENIGPALRSDGAPTAWIMKDLRIHSAYEPKSDLARERLPALLRKTTQAYDTFREAGNQMQAMLCLPLGTEVQMQGQGGLRDVVYMLELRGHAHGANFEYKAQALEALDLLRVQLSRQGETGKAPWDILKTMGISHEGA